MFLEGTRTGGSVWQMSFGRDFGKLNLKELVR